MGQNQYKRLWIVYKNVDINNDNYDNNLNWKYKY